MRTTTPTTADAPESKRSGIKGCFWTIGIGLILLMVGIAIGLTLWLMQENKDAKLVTAKLDRLRERGVPVDLVSLREQYISRTDPTDANAWRRIMVELGSKSFQSWCQGVPRFDGMASGSRWTETAWLAEAAERNLVTNTEDLRLRVHALARNPHPVQFLEEFDRYVNYDNQPDMMMERSRTLQKLLATEFQVAFVDRDSYACRRSVETALAVARLRREDPWSISHIFLGVQLQPLVLKNIQVAVEYDVLSEEDLEGLLRTMSAAPYLLDRIPELLYGERVILIDIAKNPAKYKVFQKGYGYSIKDWLGVASNRGVFNALEFYDRIEALEVGDVDALRSHIKQELKSIDGSIKNANAIARRQWVLTSKTVVDWELYARLLTRNAIIDRFVRHALAIRLFERRKGRFPSSLGELSEIGFDSMRWKQWGGKPFVYWISDQGATLTATPTEHDTPEANPDDYLFLRLRP